MMAMTMKGFRDMHSGDIDWSFPYQWFEDLFIKELAPHWYEATFSESGLFHPQLDRQWRPYGEAFATLRSQTRLLYLFAAAYRYTGIERYRQAVEKGAAFLFEYFADRNRGGWFRCCGPDGVVLDNAKDAYGHAFAVFGLAHAGMATGDSACLTAATETAQLLEERFVDRYGGLCWVMDVDFNDLDEIRAQNPVMHFTEALLALSEAENNPERVEQARRWIDFLFTSCAHGDIPLAEDYDLHWRPLEPGNGGRIVLGHQVEWAFLLSRAVELGLPDQYCRIGNDCLDAGIRLGLDAVNGGLYTVAVPGNGVTSTRKGFWEQAETIRALLHYAVLRGREENDKIWEPLRKTVTFYRRFFHDEACGGIYPGTQSDGTRLKSDKGSEGKLDYHTAGMCTEIMRLRNRE